ncbi:MAG: universal stress protein [Hyphomicrobiaceae bacterium]|nr:universal stress protein [Hyphomicrobiaceae bacterium]
MSGKAVRLIEEELAKQKTDLVVMGRLTRSRVARTLKGGVVEAVLKLSKYDMIVIPVRVPS